MTRPKPNSERVQTRRRITIALMMVGMAAALGFLLAALLHGRQRETAEAKQKELESRMHSALVAERQALDRLVTRAHELGSSREIRSERAAEKADGPDRVGDGQWQLFPRCEQGFVDLVLFNTATLGADMLYRHVELNPMDKYLQPRERSYLSTVVTDYKRLIIDLEALEVATLERESDLMIAAGAARQITDKDYVTTQPTSEEIEQEKDPMVKAALKSGPIRVYNFERGEDVSTTRNGVRYHMRSSGMPVTRLVRVASLYVKQECAAIIINYCLSIGVCPSTRAEEMYKDLYRRRPFIAK